MLRAPSALAFVLSLQGQTPYLGQPAPGREPKLFAPGIVSTGLYERDFAVTADGREMFFGILGSGHAQILSCRMEDGRWTAPEVLPFSGGPVVMDLEPALSFDGKRLFFLSTRPKDGGAAKPGWVNQDLWVSEREGKGWGAPTRLDESINSDDEEFFPSLTAGGAMYFTRGKDAGKVSAVWRARPHGNGFHKAEPLPAVINGGGPVFNAAISPDESMLVFCAANRKGNLGGTDYWISFRGLDDTWSEPVNLGAPFNGTGLQAISPAFSTDGKYFFFASNRKAEARTSRRTYADLQKAWTSPGNGNPDIWWVDVEVLRGLKK